jgi:hypothetical protein
MYQRRGPAPSGVSKFAAQEGLFVSSSGFKSNVQKELLEALFVHYDEVDEDLKTESFP